MRTIATFSMITVSCSLAIAQGPAPALIGYWHNWNDASAPYIALDQIDPRYNIIEVSFAEPAPGTTSEMQFVPSADAPAEFAARVQALHALGRKVLISIGGANGTVQLNDDAERDQFINTVTAILTTYGFDGIDLDLEGASVSITGGTIASPIDAGIVRLIEAVRTIMSQFRAATGQKLFLTMAPETAFVQGGMSAFGGIWGAYLPVIDALRDSLDILQVQLYNSGSMFGLDGGTYAQGTADFIVGQTEAVIHGFNTSGGFFNGLPPEKVAVALPACANAAGGGYTDTATVAAAMKYLLGAGPQPGSYTLAQATGYPTLRGMMTWSINWDAVAACDGAYSYAENFERIFGELSTDMGMEPWEHPCLFPNPAVDELFVGAGFRGPVTVLDLAGRVVLLTTASGNGRPIDLRQLTMGSYILSGTFDRRPVRIPFVKD